MLSRSLELLGYSGLSLQVRTSCPLVIIFLPIQSLLGSSGITTKNRLCSKYTTRVIEKAPELSVSHNDGLSKSTIVLGSTESFLKLIAPIIALPKPDPPCLDALLQEDSYKQISSRWMKPTLSSNCPMQVRSIMFACSYLELVRLLDDIVSELGLNRCSNHRVCVVPFPEGYGATVHFHWPGKGFQLLGM